MTHLAVYSDFVKYIVSQQGLFELFIRHDFSGAFLHLVLEARLLRTAKLRNRDKRSKS